MGAIVKRGKTYFVDYYFAGKRVREKIGPNKKEAEAELGTILKEIREGTFRHRAAKTITLKDAAKKYLTLCAHGRSGDDKRRYLGTFCGDFPGRALMDLRKEEIEGWLAQRRETPTVRVKMAGGKEIRTEYPRSVATCNREFAAVRHFLNKCSEWGYLYISPCAGIKPKREPKGRVRYLSVEESALLIQKATAHLRPIIVLSLETGMRKAEVLGVKWENVDFTGRAIYIPKTKNGESRNVPMSERLAAMLKSMPRRIGSPYVFSKKKDGRPYIDVRTAFENACDKAGIKDFRFHDLRHTAASHMAMGGAPLKAIGAILGHKTSAMTDRYAHLSNAHLRDAVNAMPDFTGHDLGTNEKGAAGE